MWTPDDKGPSFMEYAKEFAVAFIEVAIILGGTALMVFALLVLG